MRQQRVAFVLLLLLTVLAACGPGHLGGNIIAFIRDGHLWTIDPDGANAFEIVAQGPPVVSYAWSPNHQLLTFRALDADFAKTSSARQLASNALTGQIGDVPGTENTIGVDGGTPITIAFSSPDVRYSSALWNSTGTRLLFRQTSGPAKGPLTAQWWVSQNDQPGGIAIKSLPDSYSIPSFSSDKQQLAIGNSQQGLFTTTLAGTGQSFIQHEPLVGHPLSASLERVLWQPGHGNAQLLYALPVPHSQDVSLVQLVLRASNGQVTTLATCHCRQFAWSPDGNYVLYSTDSVYTLVDSAGQASFTITGVDGSVPYWSPDSRFLLFDGPHTLTLVQVASKQKTVLLTDRANASEAAVKEALPAVYALLQPVPNSIWAADSRHFLFLSGQRLLWQGHQLNKGQGLYTVTIDNAGHQAAAPVIVDTGRDTQAGWTYQDPNTSFLY